MFSFRFTSIELYILPLYSQVILLVLYELLLLTLLLNLGYSALPLLCLFNASSKLNILHLSEQLSTSFNHSFSLDKWGKSLI